MKAVGSYCCSVEDNPSASSKRNGLCCKPRPLSFRGWGMGVTKSAGRLSGLIHCVGCPCSSSSQCLAGYSYGELRIGLAKKSFSTGNPSGLVRCRPFGWVDSGCPASRTEALSPVNPSRHCKSLLGISVASRWAIVDSSSCQCRNYCLQPQPCTT